MSGNIITLRECYLLGVYSLSISIVAYFLGPYSSLDMFIYALIFFAIPLIHRARNILKEDIE